jgi:predicted RNA binding protein YcfA (HicA-like mRNA interferase family)
MKLPREMSGLELVHALGKYGYQITRQSGSHIRLTTISQGEHHLTIPDHKSLKLGIVSAILAEVALHFDIDKNELITQLFDK